MTNPKRRELQFPFCESRTNGIFWSWHDVENSLAHSKKQGVDRRRKSLYPYGLRPASAILFKDATKGILFTQNTCDARATNGDCRIRHDVRFRDPLFSSHECIHVRCAGAHDKYFPSRPSIPPGDSAKTGAPHHEHSERSHVHADHDRCDHLDRNASATETNIRTPTRISSCHRRRRNETRTFER